MCNILFNVLIGINDFFLLVHFCVKDKLHLKIVKYSQLIRNALLDEYKKKTELLLYKWLICLDVLNMNKEIIRSDEENVDFILLISSSLCTKLWTRNFFCAETKRGSTRVCRDFFIITQNKRRNLIITVIFTLDYKTEQKNTLFDGVLVQLSERQKPQDSTFYERELFLCSILLSFYHTDCQWERASATQIMTLLMGEKRNTSYHWILILFVTHHS